MGFLSGSAVPRGHPGDRRPRTLALRLAAAAVALLHRAFVRFVGFGGLWVGRWPRLAGLPRPVVGLGGVDRRRRLDWPARARLRGSTGPDARG